MIPLGVEMSVVHEMRLGRALIDLWDFYQRMEMHPTGWVAADVLRLEEIRQTVEAERRLTESARKLNVQENIDIFTPFRALTASPREKSTKHGNTLPPYQWDTRPPSAQKLPGFVDGCPPPAPPAIVDDGVRSAAKTADAPVLTRRSADAPRKADAKIRSRGAKRRRGGRQSRTLGGKDKSHRKRHRRPRPSVKKKGRKKTERVRAVLAAREEK